MKSKICCKCKEKKSVDEFYKDKYTKDGLTSSCKECLKSCHHSFKGLTSRIYNTQKQNSKKRNHPLPNYTREEFIDWFKDQRNWETLFKKWIESNYSKYLVPSADRKDDYKPYTLDNLRLTTWNKNRLRIYEDQKNGNNNKINKAVVQYDLEENFIDDYHSINHAARVTKIHCSNICNCCKGKKGYLQAGGFIWKYK